MTQILCAQGQDIPHKAMRPHPSFMCSGPGHIYKAISTHLLIADAVSAPARSREAAAADRE